MLLAFLKLNKGAFIIILSKELAFYYSIYSLLFRLHAPIAFFIRLVSFTHSLLINEHTEILNAINTCINLKMLCIKGKVVLWVSPCLMIIHAHEHVQFVY